MKGENAVDHNYYMIQEISVRLQESWQLGKVR